MIDQAALEILKPLGVAIPLVAILYLLLRQATDERRAITADFLVTLRETIKGGTEQSQNVTTHLAALASSVADMKAAASAEHRQSIEQLQRIATTLEVRSTMPVGGTA